MTEAGPLGRPATVTDRLPLAMAYATITWLGAVDAVTVTVQEAGVEV
jgi:hypothetical protein